MVEAPGTAPDTAGLQDQPGPLSRPHKVVPRRRFERRSSVLQTDVLNHNHYRGVLERPAGNDPKAA